MGSPKQTAIWIIAGCAVVYVAAAVLLPLLGLAIIFRREIRDFVRGEAGAGGSGRIVFRPVEPPPAEAADLDAAAKVLDSRLFSVLGPGCLTRVEGRRVVVLVARPATYRKDVIERLATGRGRLEFRIVAHRVRDRDDADFDHLLALKNAGRPSDNAAFRWCKGSDDYFEHHESRRLPPEWVYVVDATSKTVELLVRVDDGQDVTGRDVGQAWPDARPDGEPIIGLRIRPEAQGRFAALTKPENKGRHLAIMLDGVVHSAPMLMAQLSSGAIIEGYPGRQAERDAAVALLNSGELPVQLEPVGTGGLARN